MSAAKQPETWASTAAHLETVARGLRRRVGGLQLGLPISPEDREQVDDCIDQIRHLLNMLDTLRVTARVGGERS